MPTPQPREDAARKAALVGVLTLERTAQKAVAQAVQLVAGHATSFRLPVGPTSLLVAQSAASAITDARQAATVRSARSFTTQTSQPAQATGDASDNDDAWDPDAAAEAIGRRFTKLVADHQTPGMTAALAFPIAAQSLQPAIRGIVTTQVMAAWNAEARRLARTSRVEIVQTWHSELDACQECAGLDGNTVRGDQQFDEGDPPLHAHCRCYISSSADEASALDVAEELIDELGVENSEYLREGMRDLTTHRGAYGGAGAVKAERIATGEVAAVNTGKKLPGITVVVDGNDIILRDGRHRLVAAREAGANHIKATVITYANGEKLERETVLSIRGKRQ